MLAQSIDNSLKSTSASRRWQDDAWKECQTFVWEWDRSQGSSLDRPSSHIIPHLGFFPCDRSTFRHGIGRHFTTDKTLCLHKTQAGEDSPKGRNPKVAYSRPLSRRSQDPRGCEPWENTQGLHLLVQACSCYSPSLRNDPQMPWWYTLPNSEQELWQIQQHPFRCLSSNLHKQEAQPPHLSSHQESTPNGVG